MKGRPKKPEGEVRGKFVRIRLTDEEHDILEKAAKVKRLQLSSWVRSEMLALAEILLTRKK